MSDVHMGKNVFVFIRDKNAWGDTTVTNMDILVKKKKPCEQCPWYQQ